MRILLVNCLKHLVCGRFGKAKHNKGREGFLQMSGTAVGKKDGGGCAVFGFGNLVLEVYDNPLGSLDANSLDRLAIP